MPSISLILPLRSLDAGSFSRLARFAREFMECLDAERPPVVDRPAKLQIASNSSKATLTCEVLLPAARISRVNISQGSESVCSFRHWRISNWCLEEALKQAIDTSAAPVVACCDPAQLPDPTRFRELCVRLARADFIAARRRATVASKLLLAATQFPRRAVIGVQRRDPDFLCWVALREAVAELRWRPSAHRYLAELVAARGFRVAEFRVTDEPAFVRPMLSAPHRVARNLLAAWKLGRKTEQANAELQQERSRAPTSQESARQRRAPHRRAA